MFFMWHHAWESRGGGGRGPVTAAAESADCGDQTIHQGAAHSVAVSRVY
jgi:hypothetical protein